ncbi:hypothetical protein PINS_up009782 [Pythium insidiosum]|nr:hypothetical protein PINS_up009782 [Pythium insidiosum]
MSIKKKLSAGRPHAKVASSSPHATATFTVNGRVVGPRVSVERRRDTHKAALKTSLASKRHATRKPVALKAASALDLEDKLSMSLDALVKRKQQQQ